MSILITGHTGFVGKALVASMQDPTLKLVGRRILPGQAGHFFQKELTALTDYSDCLAGVTTVIHAAARVHVMEDKVQDPIAAYRAVNVDGTLNLARQAAHHGVKRFIFISSIKVNGEATAPEQRFSAFDLPQPQDPYGISKWEAEQELHKLAADSAMEIVIIRPPLVYGPGVKANFAAMLRVAKKNLPLPLGAIHNKRSMVALDNLIDLIRTCIAHPLAANQTFLVSDDDDVSTTGMLQLMTRAYGKTPHLIPIPMSWFLWLGRLTGKQAVISRLCGNLQVDIRHTRKTLGWQPPLSVAQGISRCIGDKGAD